MLSAARFAMMGASVPRALAYKASANTPSGATVAKPSGIVVGDLVFVVIQGQAGGDATLTTASGDAWNVNRISWATSGYGYKSCLFWKILNATDVSNNWTIATGGGPALAVAYDVGGIATVTVKSTKEQAAGQSSLVLTGYTAAEGALGAVTVMTDRDDDASDTIAGGFTRRAFYQVTTTGNAVADNTAYVSGNVTWTSVNGGSSFAEVGWLLEIT